MNIENRITEIEPGKFRLEISLEEVLQFTKDYPSEERARKGQLEFLIKGPNVSKKSTGYKKD
jgi:hypothetical protein